MPAYRHKDASRDDELVIIIEDKSMFTKDSAGNWTPGFEIIDGHTVKAHPDIINALVADAERLWTLEELRDFMRVLEVLGPQP